VFEEKLDSFDTLRGIVAKLRAPGGCPWDRKQTHDSLKPYLLEECYEAMEALDEGDSQKLCEELGDLMLEIALHTQIASEAGEFGMEDVLRSINNKLVHRHPHVFGDAEVKDARDVAIRWEELKSEELKEGESILTGVPKQMPALAASQSIQRRVAQVGFDWKDVGGVMKKLTEEVRELEDADYQERVHELGDLLFALVNVARWLDVDAEDTLRLANERFRRRFSYMEEVCHQRGVLLSSLSLEEQDALWEQAKLQMEV
jgi:tetrapyrrole methylase family protein/MazG family protein